MALQAPQSLSGLVLMSGYYRPTPRPDALLLSGPAVPILGDVMRYTVSPPLGRLLAPLILKTVFAPVEVSPRFRQAYPISMSLRPSQLRASAAESALLMADAAALQARVAELDVPTLVLTGRDDRLVDAAHHSQWLAERVAGAAFVSLDGVGHMLHHTASEEVAQTIEGFVAGAAATAEAEAAERPAGLH
jgi:pimeloyl-ACP methyl ester carboxylesterase